MSTDEEKFEVTEEGVNALFQVGLERMAEFDWSSVTREDAISYIIINTVADSLRELTGCTTELVDATVDQSLDVLRRVIAPETEAADA